MAVAVGEILIQSTQDNAYLFSTLRTPLSLIFTLLLTLTLTLIPNPNPNRPLNELSFLTQRPCNVHTGINTVI